MTTREERETQKSWYRNRLDPDVGTRFYYMLPVTPRDWERELPRPARARL